MTRLLRALVAMLLLCGVALSAFGCLPFKEKKTTAPTGDASTAPSASTTADEPTFQEVLELYAAYDFGGDTYRIIASGENVFSEDAFGNGNVVSDVIYRRNRAVEALLSVEIEYVPVTQYTDTATLCRWITSEWSNYEGRCDLVMLPAVSMGVLAVYGGLFVDLRTIGEMDLSDVWWSRSAVDALTVNGNTFLTVGAINHDAVYNSEVLLYNRDAFETLFPKRDLDRIVANAQWTREQLLRFSVALPGHSTMEYGYMGDVESMAETLLISSELSVFSTLSPSGYSFDLNAASRLVDSLRTWGTMERANWHLSDDRGQSLEMFCNERTLFCSVRLRDLMGGALDDLSFAWSLLPFPSFAEGEAYTTAVSGEYSALAIPVGCDPHRAAVVLNALNAYDYYTVLPTMYNHMLSGKYAADQREAAMLDSILAARSFSFARIYGGDPEVNAGEYFLLLDSLLTGESIADLMRSRAKQVRDHWICVFRSFGHSLEECEKFPPPDSLYSNEVMG